MPLPTTSLSQGQEQLPNIASPEHTTNPQGVLAQLNTPPLTATLRQALAVISTAMSPSALEMPTTA